MTIEPAVPYASARERYASVGVDAEVAISTATAVRLSVHCWQGDDVAGLERREYVSGSGGIQTTGHYPGRARDGDELRADLDVALSLLPGLHSVNLHAMYAEETGPFVDRDAIETRHFERWIQWARHRALGLDFNATLFGHLLADQGLTLASPEPSVRDFWTEHVRRCRAIGADMGRHLGTPCRHNLWVPDGSKDETVDRLGSRLRLVNALDRVYEPRYDAAYLLDALESKLFGIGSESFVAGSHELYLGYCMTRGIAPCLDMGHFHPTESVADKISALLPFHERILVHVSRGIRWDSDHIVILDDPIRQVAQEIVRSAALERVHLALDYFDASVNRIAAWVIGVRATRLALLQALLEPTHLLREMEASGDRTGRLALLETTKALPWPAVWDELCARADVPIGSDWLARIRRHELDVLAARG